MEKADIKKKIHLALVALLIYVQKVTSFSTSPSAITSCSSSTANIPFNFSINATEKIFGTRTLFFVTGKIAESDGTTLTPVPGYSSRLTAYGTSVISLSNITVADAGTYTYVIVLLPDGNEFTATTALSVQVAPLAPPSGCQVSSENQPGNKPTCTVNTNSGNCGTPSLIAFLVNSTFTCKVGETYQCCATSAALTCYSGSSNNFCKLFTCTAATTTTTVVIETSETSASTSSIISTSTINTSTSMTAISNTSTSTINTSTINTSIINTSTAKQGGNDSHQLVIIISVSAGVIVLVTVFIICCCLHQRRKRRKDQTKHKAHHAIARNGPNSTNEQNELQNVTKTKQVDSCVKM